MARPPDEIRESTILVEVTATRPPATQTPPPTATPLPGVQTMNTLRVHIGPGDLFAVVGTLAGGEEVDVVGRDSDGEWVSIIFPPNSTARGWVEAGSLLNLPPEDLESLAVVAPTPLPVFVPTPGPVFAGATNSGSGGTATNGSSNGAGDNSPAGNLPPTPTPANTGPGDLRVTSISLRSDGRVDVAIENAGPGDLRNSSIFLRVRDLGSRGETIIYNGTIQAGQGMTFTSGSFRVTPPDVVIAIIDPSATLNDADRSNNSLTVEFEPEPTAIPGTGTGGG